MNKYIKSVNKTSIGDDKFRVFILLGEDRPGLVQQLDKICTVEEDDNSYIHAIVKKENLSLLDDILKCEDE